MTAAKRAEYTANQRAKRQAARSGLTQRRHAPTLDRMDAEAAASLPSLRAGDVARERRYVSPVYDVMIACERGL